VGGMGVTRLLAAVGGALVVAGIYLAWGLAPALIVAGGFVIAFAVLLVEVPERPEPTTVPPACDAAGGPPPGFSGRTPGGAVAERAESVAGSAPARPGG
jgi:hypothetical protein